MKNSGFSLLYVIMILAAIAIAASQIVTEPSLEFLDQRLSLKASADLRTIERAAQLYFQSGIGNQPWPQDFSELSSILPDGFPDKNPFDGVKGANGAYTISRVLRDGPQGPPLGIVISTQMPTEEAHRVEYADAQVELTDLGNGLSQVDLYVMEPGLERSHSHLLHRQGDSLYGGLSLSPSRGAQPVHSGKYVSKNGEALSLDWGEGAPDLLRETLHNIGADNLDRDENAQLRISFRQKDGHYGARPSSRLLEAFKIGFLGDSFRDASGAFPLGRTHNTNMATFSLSSAAVGFYDGSQVSDHNPDLAQPLSDSNYELLGYGARIDFLPYAKPLENLSHLKFHPEYLGAVSISPGALLLAPDIDYRRAAVRDLSDWDPLTRLAAIGGAIYFEPADQEGLNSKILTGEPPKLLGAFGRDSEGKFTRLLVVKGTEGLVLEPNVKDESSLLAIKFAYEEQTQSNEMVFCSADGFSIQEEPTVPTNVSEFWTDIGTDSDRSTVANGPTVSFASVSSREKPYSWIGMATSPAMHQRLNGHTLNFMEFLDPQTSSTPFQKPFATNGSVSPSTTMTVQQFNKGARYDQMPALIKRIRLNGAQVDNLEIYQYDRVKFMSELEIGKYDYETPDNSQPPRTANGDYASLWKDTLMTDTLPDSGRVRIFQKADEPRFIDVQARRFLDENGEDASTGFRRKKEHFLGCMENELDNAKGDSCEVKIPKCAIGQVARMFIGFDGIWMPEQVGPGIPYKEEEWMFDAWKETDGENWIVHCQAWRGENQCSGQGCVKLPCYVTYAVGCFKKI